MVRRTVRNIVIVLIFLAFYFFIILPYLIPTIESWFNAFMEKSGSMFVFNTTKIEYVYNATTGNIESVKTIQTVDYRPIMTFIFYIIVYFVIPILIPLWMLIRRW